MSCRFIRGSNARVAQQMAPHSPRFIWMRNQLAFIILHINKLRNTETRVVVFRSKLMIDWNHGKFQLNESVRMSYQTSQSASDFADISLRFGVASRKWAHLTVELSALSSCCEIEKVQSWIERIYSVVLCFLESFSLNLFFFNRAQTINKMMINCLLWWRASEWRGAKEFQHVAVWVS